MCKVHVTGPCYGAGMVGISIAEIIEQLLWSAGTRDEREAVLRQFGATDEEIRIVHEEMDRMIAEGAARIVDFE